MGNPQPEKIASLSSVRSAPTLTQRTDWAERHVEEILSVPFISEFVFRSVRTNEGPKQEEVADILILYRATALIVELKCQEDPTVRTPQKTELWVRKRTKEGWSQIRRAFTRKKNLPVWCDHPRRGRVKFPDGLPPIQHAIVAVETLQSVDLQGDALNLPLDRDGVPITYLSVNDFLNLVVQLRSVPELMDYLQARRSLPQADLRMIGDESSLFSFYLLNDGSFAGCAGHSYARMVVADQQDRLEAALQRKFEADQYSYLLEHVADELANRNPKFSDGVPLPLLSACDPVTERQNYLEMQAALADLRFRERAELGRAFHGVIERVTDKIEGFTFRVALFDSMPDWVYVLGASKSVDRAELLSRMMLLLGGAMAFYNKPKCLVIVDRDDEGYEVAMSRPDVKPTQTHVQAGERFFGSLRIKSTNLHFLPEH